MGFLTFRVTAHHVPVDPPCRMMSGAGVGSHRAACMLVLLTKGTFKRFIADCGTRGRWPTSKHRSPLSHVGFSSMA
jgi:hypothetical protein